jgi:hypothetical protein
MLGFLHFIPTGSAGLVRRLTVKLFIAWPLLFTSDTAFGHDKGFLSGVWSWEPEGAGV